MDPSKYIIQYSWVTSGVSSGTSVHSVKKIHESLRLNNGTRDIPDVVAHEFECPLGDPSRGITVADDVSEQV